MRERERVRGANMNGKLKTVETERGIPILLDKVRQQERETCRPATCVPCPWRSVMGDGSSTKSIPCKWRGMAMLERYRAKREERQARDWGEGSKK